MLPFATIKTAIDWTFRDTRPDNRNRRENRRAKVLFFSDVPLLGQQFLVYDVARDAPDGLPQPVNRTTFPGLSWDRIDAGVNWGNGKAYFFKGTDYARFDFHTGQVEHTLPIAGNWPGLPWNTIDAAVNWGNGKVYLFKGTNYVRYDIGRDSVDPGYNPPLSIARYWSGLPWNTIDGIVQWGNGKAYIIKGAEYVVHDMVSDQTNPNRLSLVGLTMGPTGFSVTDFCNSIVQIALSMKDAHYLWGGTGARPGGSEGTLSRPNAIALVNPQRSDPANPAVFTAECNVSGHKVCGGKYANHPGAGRLDSLPPEQRLAVQAYLGGLSLVPSESWLPFLLDLSPRKFIEHSNTAIVLGEDCRARRHFDCVGFVNYCVEMAIARVRPIAYEISKPGFASWAQGISGTRDISLGAPHHPADLLLRGGAHIGFMTGDGRVVQAAETSKGLLIGPYRADAWTNRRRLTSAILHL